MKFNPSASSQKISVLQTIIEDKKEEFKDLLGAAITLAIASGYTREQIEKFTKQCLNTVVKAREINNGFKI